MIERGLGRESLGQAGPVAPNLLARGVRFAALKAARISKFREPGCDSSNGREQEQRSYMPSRVPPTADEDNQHAVQLRFRRLKVPE
jgi:hypothetical protein